MLKNIIHLQRVIFNKVNKNIDMEETTKVFDLVEFLKTINTYDYAAFRDACMKECNVDRTTWSNWRKGKYDVVGKYHDIINKVATDLFGRTVFE